MPRHLNKVAPNWLPTGPVLEHIAALRAATDCSMAQIARAARIPSTTVRVMVAGGTELAHHTIHKAILDLTSEAVDAERAWHPAEPVRRHLEMILTHEDCNRSALISASGFDPRDIDQILDGSRHGVRDITRQAMLRLTPESVRRNAYLVSDRRAKARIWAMRANDWPMSWIARELGYKGKSIPIMWKQGFVSQALDRRVEAVYASVGDRRGPSTVAGQYARSLGHYPPIHYDEQMRLIRSSIPRKRYEPNIAPQDRARRRLRIMGLTLREQSAGQIAQAVGCSEKKVERTRREIGLRLETSEVDKLLDRPFIKNGQDELVRLIAEHVEPIELGERVDAYDASDTDHVALWESLLSGATRIRARAQYVALWESLLAEHDHATEHAA